MQQVMNLVLVLMLVNLSVSVRKINITENMGNITLMNDEKGEVNVTNDNYDNTGNITQNVVINENIMAPIKQGDILGKIEYKAGEEVILEKNLVAQNDVDKSTMWNITTNLYLKWFNMLRK
jgi:D-alanyl-D-alanine carboxypeptidase (penicillin-binding protein 5/6)